MLHTRIPEALEGELRDRASHLGLSVSALVRNVLMHTFDLVGELVHDSHEVARQFRETSAGPTRRHAAPPAPEADPEPATPANDSVIVAWQPGVLNLNAVCAQCNALLPKGTTAAIGIPTQRPLQCLCMNCLDGLEAASPSRS